MAALLAKATTGKIALTAATAKTVIQAVAPANHRLRMKGWAVTFEGIVVTDTPVLVELVRQSTAGTMSALTPKKCDDSVAETIQATAQHTATAEPTTGDVLMSRLVHPQTGYEHTYPYGDEDICGGGDRIGIRCTAPQAQNVVAELKWEE